MSVGWSKNIYLQEAKKDKVKLSETELLVEEFIQEQFNETIFSASILYNLFKGINYPEVIIDDMIQDSLNECLSAPSFDYYREFEALPKNTKDLKRFKNELLEMDKKKANKIIKRLYENEVLLSQDYEDNSEEGLLKARERQDIMELFCFLADGDVNKFNYSKHSYASFFSVNKYRDFIIPINYSDNCSTVYEYIKDAEIIQTQTRIHYSHDMDELIYVHNWHFYNDGNLKFDTNIEMIAYLRDSVNGMFNHLSRSIEYNFTIVDDKRKNENWGNKSMKKNLFEVYNNNEEKKSNIEKNNKSAMALLNRFNNKRNK